MSLQQAATLLLSILLFALLLRLSYFQGFMNVDDANYLRDAHMLAGGSFSPGQNQWDTRLGLIAPVALLMRILGASENSVSIYPLAASLLSIVTTYVFGSALFSRRIGILAAFLLACFPQDIYYSTLVYPQLIGATFGCLAVLCAFRCGMPSRGRSSYALAACAGLLAFASYLCWEPYVVFVPVSLTALWMYHGSPSKIRPAMVLSSSAISGLILESLLYWHVKGTPLFRLRSARLGQQHQVADLAGHHSITLTSFFVRFPLALFNPHRQLTFLYALLFVGALFLLRRRLRDKACAFLLFWTGIVFLWCAFAVTSLHPLIPLLVEEPRYLSGLFMPVMLLIAAAIDSTHPSGTFTRQAVTE